MTPPIFPSDDAKFPAPVEFKVWITGTEQTCLDVKLAAQIVLSNGTKFLNLEKAVRADATNCTNENDTNIALNLDFGGNSISFVFKRDEALTSGWLDTIHLTYHIDNGEILNWELEFGESILNPMSNDRFCFIAATKPETFDITEKLFESNGTASFGLQYSCKGQVETETLHGTKVVFKEVDVQVGSSQHGTHLTSCPADEDVNDMIPIAVGAALLALVAIVLVAYFVGRRRSRRLAYQSV